MKITVFFLLGFFVFAALFGARLAPYDPTDMDLENVLSAPSLKHIFGTDNQGRDVFSRVVYGSRVSIGIGLLATVLSVLIGVAVGIFSGYRGGIADKICGIFVDITLSFPSLLLAIGVAVIMPPGVWSVVLALSLAGWAGFARFTRGIVLEIKHNNYVDSAQVLGVNNLRVMITHILPNCLPLVAVTGFLKLGMFILSEASLSFLGLGIPPPLPTWGGMINYGREFIQTAPWIVVFPGIALAVAVFACNVAGDILRDKLDPKTLREV